MEPQFTLISIVLLVVLFIPGFFFKRFYFQGNFARQFGSGIFAERFITSVFWGIVIQLLTLSLFISIYKVNSDSIFVFVGKIYEDLSKDKLPQFDNETFTVKNCLVYLAASILLSVSLGTVLHKLVCLLGIDKRVRVFRFQNDWNYFFKGQGIDVRSSQGKNLKWVSTEVDIIVRDGSDSNLWYSGLLNDYTISDKTGELDLITIVNARRFSKSSNGFKEIPGHCMIIPYKNVVNLNLRLIHAKRTSIFTQGEVFEQWKRAGLTVFIILFFASPFVIFYYRLSAIGAWNTMLGILVSSIAWLLLGSTVSIGFSTSPKMSGVRKVCTLFISSVLLILSIFCSYIILY
jgi:hypothetical protein